MFIIDMKSRVPIYEQLKNSTLELIGHGVLKVDDPMPSVRSLARDLGVNPNTIQKAYQEMEREGILYTVSGRGSFVTDSFFSNDRRQEEVLRKLSKIAYESKLYGIELQKAIETVQKSYEKGMSEGESD